MRKIYFLLSILLFIFVIGCSANEITKQNIRFNNNELILKVDEKIKLPIDFSGVNEQDIIIENLDDDIVKVDGMTIQALEIGHTTITASTSDNNLNSTIDVIVEAKKVKSPILTTPTDIIAIDGQTTLIFKNQSAVGASFNSFIWTVSDEKIVRINDDYTITGLKEGTATITVTLKSNPEISSTYSITVGSIIDHIILSASNLSATVKAGEYLSLRIEGFINKDFFFKSNSNQIAMVTDDGRVIGVKEGTATITAYSKTNNKIQGTIRIIIKGHTNVNYASRIVNIALEEEGYVQGANYNTKYGLWYKMNFNPWCAMFVSWSANQAGINETIIPKFASVRVGKDWFESRGLFRYKGSYSPKEGDIIFFLSNGASHAAIVLYSDGTRVYTIEGNTNFRVAQRSYLLTNLTITGYGTPNYPSYN